MSGNFSLRISAAAASVLLVLLAAGGCNRSPAPPQPVGTAPAATEDMAMDYQRDHLSLNGAWQTLAGHGQEEAFRPEVADGLPGWQERTIPGGLADRDAANPGALLKLESVWARRSFTLDAAQAGRDSVLKHNGIRFGATAWINGRKVAEHATIGPDTVLVPRGVLRAGRNELVLRVPGWGGVPRGARNRPLVPTGASTQFWGSKAPEIYDDIWLEFYDRVYVKWALAVPEIRAPRVTFRVSLDGAGERPKQVRLTAKVSQGGRALGQAELTVAPDGAPVELPVALGRAKLWSPEEPNLCRAELTASADGRPCDAVAFTFGMREIKVEGGRYRLNGRPHWFRGSNLVNEWRWGTAFQGKAKQYLVDEARTMSLSCFRTHTIPPPTDWLQVCDSYGTMVLAELPVLYNYAPFKFTPEEYGVFHAHALADAAGWITKLWNHPSVMLWVISNECEGDDEWEAGPYWRHVKALDPTRPAMRAGGKLGTPEVLDTHSCGNFHDDSEGDLLTESAEHGRTRDPGRALGDSEYMNLFSGPARAYAKWLGRADHPAGPLVFAECALEHTEAFRRAGYDLILPYMYAGWTATRNSMRSDWKPWRPGWPAPISAALHSSMAPVLASLDLYDRNYRPAQQVTTDAVLINELGREVAITLELHLTPSDPLFIPDEDALAAGKLVSRTKLTLKPYSMTRHPLAWQAPAEPGSCFLAAVTRRPGAGPVVSQRAVRSIPLPEGKLTGRRVVVIGADDAIRGWLKAHDAVAVEAGADGPIQADVVLLWDHLKVSEGEHLRAAAVLDFVKAGGRLVALHHGEKWTWKELLDFEPGPGRSARAFAVEGAKHRMLNGIEPEWLKRWNGADEPIADGSIKGEVLRTGTPLMWSDRIERTCAVSLRLGEGEALLTTLHLQKRIDPKAARYDPAADWILRNLLGP